MIIGVSGKIGSGKDLVGQIIQYLTKKDSDQDFIEELAGNEFFGDAVSDWKIRKFADKLKDIVCLLISCTRQQLEDRDFKNQELGEQWRIWYFQEKKIRVPNNFYGIFTSEREAWSFINTNMIHHLTIHSEVLTPRLLLQLLGTQCGRQIIHPDIWVNALFTDYKATGFYHCELPEDHPKYKEDYDIYPNWIITDVRFPNEAEAIRKRGGIIIRVNRLSNEVSNHESETALDDFNNFDYIIENDEGIQELIEKVRQILKREKVIS